MNETALRKWCLERAFETRALMDVPHMEVTNEADFDYRWITCGESQANRLDKMHSRMD